MEDPGYPFDPRTGPYRNGLLSGGQTPGGLLGAVMSQPGIMQQMANPPTLAQIRDGSADISAPMGLMMGMVSPTPSRLPMDLASRMGRAADEGFNTSQIWYRGTSGRESRFDPARTAARGDIETPAYFMTDSPALASEYALSRAGDRGVTADQTWGHYRQNFDRPLEQILQQSPTAARWGRSSSIRDGILNGETPLADFAQYTGLPPSAVDAIEQLRAALREHRTWAMGGEGANVMPLIARMDNLMQPRISQNFDPGIWDLMLRQAQAEGRRGILLRDVIDTPSGQGPPSNVLALFNPQDVRSVHALFDPARRGSGNLLGGVLPFGIMGGAGLLGMEAQQ